MTTDRIHLHKLVRVAVSRRAHLMLSALLRPIRCRRALSALAKYSAVKDAYRRAVVAGDTREQGRIVPELNAAMTARLKAEIALGAGQ